MLHHDDGDGSKERRKMGCVDLETELLLFSVINDWQKKYRNEMIMSVPHK